MSNYRIIGADGKMYGPAELEQVRQWLAEGRADSRTPVYVEGSASWTYLGMLPELAPQTGARPATIGALSSAKSVRGTNGFATAGLICGFLSWTCCCCPPFNLLGLIFSIIALVQISSQEPRQEGRILAIVGLLLSIASIICLCLYGALSLTLNPDSFNWQSSQ